MGYPVIPCVHTDETGGGEELPILAVPIMGWEEAVFIPLTRNVGLRCRRSQVMIDRSVPVAELSIEVRFFALSSNCPIAGVQSLATVRLVTGPRRERPTCSGGLRGGLRNGRSELNPDELAAISPGHHTLDLRDDLVFASHQRAT